MSRKAGRRKAASGETVSVRTGGSGTESGRPKPPQRPSSEPAAPAAPAGVFSTKSKLLLAVGLLLLYATIGAWGHFDFSDLMGYYDLLAGAFLKGQLHIDIRPDQMYIHDLIPYEGRYYLQWGPFPALLHAAAKLLGLKLSDRMACILAGWLSSLIFLEILLVLRRRFFPALARGWCVWFFLAFALATPTAIVSLRGTVYHESIVVGALCVLWAFYASLRYQESPSLGWAAACGAGVALALATRLTLAVYAIGLFGFLLAIQHLKKRPLPSAAWHLGAFGLPILLAGSLQMAYNQARFGSPFDYGNRYLPSYVEGERAFAASRIPENVRHYLLAPVQWTGDFPWLEHKGWEPLVETKRAEDMSSLLLASPFLLFAALCWPVLRSKDSPPRDLRLFVGAAAVSSGLAFLAMLCFISAARRYSQDFVPVWMILAFAGVGLHSARITAWRRWRAPAWAVLVVSALLHVHLSFTQPFTWDPPDLNIMKTFVAWSPTARRILPGPRLDKEEAIIRNDLGTLYLQQLRFNDALDQLQKASELMPNEPRIQQNLELARKWAKAPETENRNP